MLKSIYGKDFYDKTIKNLSSIEFNDLCENLIKGVPISTPVFDGAKEKNVTDMLKLAKFTYFWTNTYYGMEEQD